MLWPVSAECVRIGVRAIACVFEHMQSSDRERWAIDDAAGGEATDFSCNH